MKKHGDHWNRLSSFQKRSYEKRAQALKLDKVAQAQAHLHHHLTKGLYLKHRMDEAASADPVPNKLSSCCFLPDDLAELAAHFNQPCPGRKGVEKSRLQQFQPASPLGFSEVSDLSSRSLITEVLGEQGPAWLSSLCRHRDKLETAIFAVFLDGGWKTWRFLYASLRPLTLCLLPCSAIVPGAGGPSLVAGDAGSRDTMFNRQFFSYVLGSFASDAVLVNVEWDGLYVYLESGFGSEGVLYTYDCLLPLPPLVAAWQSEMEKPPASSSGTAGKQGKGKSRSKTEATTEVPAWLSSFLGAPSSDYPVGHEGDTTSSIQPSADDVEVDEVDAIFHGLCAALHSRREGWESDVLETEHFQQSLVEDKRLLGKKGDVIHAMLVQVKKGGDMHYFVANHNLPMAARFEISVYSEEGAAAMIKGWCARLLFLYGLWKERVDDATAFAPHHLDGWREPVEITVCREKWPKRANKRCDGICGMRPS
eukprot:6490257-Amphidinium_carterae.2